MNKLNEYFIRFFFIFLQEYFIFYNTLISSIFTRYNHLFSHTSLRYFLDHLNNN